MDIAEMIDSERLDELADRMERAMPIVWCEASGPDDSHNGNQPHREIAGECVWPHEVGPAGPEPKADETLRFEGES